MHKAACHLWCPSQYLFWSFPHVYRNSMRRTLFSIQIPGGMPSACVHCSARTTSDLCWMLSRRLDVTSTDSAECWSSFLLSLGLLERAPVLFSLRYPPAGLCLNYIADKSMLETYPLRGRDRKIAYLFASSMHTVFQLLAVDCVFCQTSQEYIRFYNKWCASIQIILFTLVAYWFHDTMFIRQ